MIKNRNTGPGARGVLPQLVLLLGSLVLAGPGSGNEPACFNAGILNAWDCTKSEAEKGIPDYPYHTIKVVLADKADAAELNDILPLERAGEVPLPSGKRVVFLGRFRDSMKAFRVVEKCKETHAQACAKFAPKVTTIGAEEQPKKSKRKAVGDVRNLKVTAAGDLFKPRSLAVDISETTITRAVDRTVNSLTPKGLLKLPKSLRHVLWVDVREGDLHVLEQDNGSYRIAETMSVSIGKNGYGKVQRGDKKTPVGVYRLLSYLPDADLDDFYGVGAFTMNYPNAIDLIHERTGSGIWLHGLPKGRHHRPLKDSDGCVVLSNTMIKNIGRYIDLQGTPIVLDDSLEWVAGDEIDGTRRELEGAIESWRKAWSSIDNDLYLSFYAKDFTNLDKNLDEWKRYKRRIHGSKTFIKVRLSDLSLLGYPGEKETVLARFYQRYESSNFRASGWKEQVWRKEGPDQWRIVYERG